MTPPPMVTIDREISTPQGPVASVAGRDFQQWLKKRSESWWPHTTRTAQRRGSSDTYDGHRAPCNPELEVFSS
eukprot:4341226-Lingulodinium_polyedra.AAC.1